MIAAFARNAARTALAAAVVGASAVGLFSTATTVANAQGDFGPDTCLEGYVWREANSADHVCVSPATRTQTSADNAAAGSRKAGGGAYGPNTCVNGYVWRDAYDGDVVCVTTATRQQAQNDNAAAADHKASLNIWLSDYEAPRPCSNGECTVTSDTGSQYQINGDHFDNGSITLTVTSNNGPRIATYTVTASAHSGNPGASFGYKTPMYNPNSGFHATCKGGTDAYIQAYDPTSQRWSNRLQFQKDCKA